MQIFCLPDLRPQIVLKNLEINLAVARQFFVVHPARQFGEGFFRECQPGIAGFGRNVIQLIVETMIAEAGRLQRLLPKIFVEIIFEKCGELRVRGCLRENGLSREKYQTQRENDAANFWHFPCAF